MNINIIAVTIKTVRVAFVSQAAECLPHCQVNPSLDEDHGHLPSEKKHNLLSIVCRGMNKMNNIMQTTYSNAFTWK